jgi:hypothetical protein
MLVKRTKSGKLSLTMRYDERHLLFKAFCNFLEGESVTIWRLKIIQEADVMRRLFYHTLNEVMIQKDFKLLFHTSTKMQLNQSQCLAILWLLRDYDRDMVLLQMKGELHKQLS